MRIKGCLRFQALCLIFSGLMLQNKAIAEAEVEVNAVYKFKDSTKPFTLYKEPYAESSVETSKPKEVKIQETDMEPMEIGRPEPRNEAASNPSPKEQPQAEEERIESYHRKGRENPQRPTIIDPSVFEEPSKSTTPEPTSSLFNFENFGLIQPAFAKRSDQAEQITQGKPYPLPHKVFWNQGVGPFQKKRSFLVKMIPSNGLCEEGSNPIEIQELDSKQPAKQRCVKQGEPVLIEVSKDEGLTVLNGKSAPIWKEKGVNLKTQDKKYLEEKMQQKLEEIEKKYAKEREILEQRYQSEVRNLKSRYKDL